MKNIKKLLMPFAVGIALSIIPISAYSLSNMNKKFTIYKTVNCVSCCPPTIRLEDPIGLPITCELTGESPDDGSGVTICSYNCGLGGGGEY